MGLFKSVKRAVKKVTKPVAKVLDKVIPNEVKPFLPYAAALAPYMLPVAGVGATPSFFQSSIGRALLSGGANLGSQLAQEGSEGDFSGLSTLLAAAQGYGTTPGAAEKLRSGIISEAPNNIGKPLTFLDKTKNVGLETLAKGAESLGKARDILSPGGAEVGLNMETAKAAMIPFTQGSGDLAMATARKAMQDYETELAAFNEQAGASQSASNSARRNAIISSMMAANFEQNIIDDTLSQIGLRDGGRVNFDKGGDVEIGIMSIQDAAENSPMSNESVPQMYVSDSAGVIALADGDAVKGRTMDMMVSGAVEPYGKEDFRDSDGYERFVDVFKEYKMMDDQKNQELNFEGMNKGGIAALNMGGSVLPSGKEMDYRQGGMIPMGSKERADDVPARLSKNEFVMTADAVRAAGGGSVNQGAKRMYELMNNLEARV